MEIAFLSFHKQFVLPSALENQLDMLNVFNLQEDKGAIQIYEEEPVQHVSEDIIDKHTEDSDDIWINKRLHLALMLRMSSFVKMLIPPPRTH